MAPEGYTFILKTSVYEWCILFYLLDWIYVECNVNIHCWMWDFYYFFFLYTRSLWLVKMWVIDSVKPKPQSYHTRVFSECKESFVCLQSTSKSSVLWLPSQREEKPEVVTFPLKTNYWHVQITSGRWSCTWKLWCYNLMIKSWFFAPWLFDVLDFC